METSMIITWIILMVVMNYGSYDSHDSHDSHINDSEYINEKL